MGLNSVLDPDEFGKLCLEIIQLEKPSTNAIYEKDKFCIRNLETGSVTYLMNFYETYQKDPHTLEGQLKLMAKLTTSERIPSIPENYGEAKEKILPRVRDRWYYQRMELVDTVDKVIGKGGFVTYKPFAEHLGAELVYDMPELIVSIGEERINSWKVPFTEIFATACENLLRISEVDLEWEQPVKDVKVYVSPYRDNYDASRMLIFDVLHPKLKLNIDGDICAFIPNRDYLIVTGSCDPEGLEYASKLSLQISANCPRPMISLPFKMIPRVNGISHCNWEFFIPNKEMSKDISQIFEQIYVQQISIFYNDQKSVLELFHKKKGIDSLKVATLYITTNSVDGSRCTLSMVKKVNTLLPKSQLVSFIQEDDTADPIVRWEIFEEVMSQKLERQEGLYPERYLMKELPSVEQLELLSKKQQEWDELHGTITPPSSPSLSDNDQSSSSKKSRELSDNEGDDSSKRRKL